MKPCMLAKCQQGCGCKSLRGRESMSDIFTFIRLAWENIWKQKAIWLFSVLSVVPQFLFRIFPNKPQPSLFVLILLIGVFIVFIYFWYASNIGVPYLAYCFSIGKTVNVRDTFTAINKFSGRIIGFSCLGLLTLLPCLIFAVIISTRDSNFTTNFPNDTTLILLPLSLLSAFWHFCIVGFFANDWGIRKSIKEAWILYTNHFKILASVGIILRGILQIINIATVSFVLLIQSGFTSSSLSNLNFINPVAALSDNILFLLINAVVQITWLPFAAFVYILAYLKFSSAKIHI